MAPLIQGHQSVTWSQAVGERCEEQATTEVTVRGEDRDAGSAAVLVGDLTATWSRPV